MGRPGRRRRPTLTSVGPTHRRASSRIPLRTGSTSRPTRPTWPTGPTTAGTTHRRSALSRALTPVVVPPTYAETVVALVALTAVAFFRLGPAALRGAPWAEDGRVFLQGAVDSGPLSGLLEPYAGYALVLPRLQADLVLLLPLDAVGVAICVVAALTQAAMGFLVLLLVRAHTPGRPVWGWLAALGVAAVPVGLETVGNVANDQWYLLVGSCAVALWTPSTRVGTVLACVVVVLTVTSTPFGFLPVASAGLVWLLTWGRHALWLAAVGTAGFAVQAVVILTAPARLPTPDTSAAEIGAGFLRRVVADAVLGSARHDGLPATGTTAGVVVLVLVVGLLVAVGVLRGWEAVLAPAYLVGLSLVVYLVILGASRAPTDNAAFAGRYFVAPVAFLLAAVVLAAARAWGPGREGGSTTGAGRGTVPVVATRVLGAALVLTSAVGVASSWQIPSEDPRLAYVGWSAVIDEARDECGAGAATTTVPISPPGWAVTLRCTDVGP